MKISAALITQFGTFMALALRLALPFSLIEAAQSQTILITRDFPYLERISGVAVDATGVYLVGNPAPVVYGPPFIRKTDLNGAELWTRQLGSSQQDGAAFGVAVSASGIYVVGFTNSQGSPSQLGDAFFSKYDPHGTELWTRRFGPSARDRVFGVAAHATGIYVVGEADPLPGTGSSSGGIFVRKYDADGNELWTRQDQSGYGNGGTSSIAVDATGVYGIGSSRSSRALWKYDATGRILWTRILPATGGTSLAVDDTGVYVAQGGSLSKFDTTGNELWSRLVDSVATNVAVDESSVYVVGTVGPFVGSGLTAFPGQCSSGYTDAFARKYDSAGSLLWTRQFGTSASDYSTGVAVDATGVWVAGFRELGARSFLTKLEKTAPAVNPSIPRITAECVVNAASYLGGGVAPGEIVTIFGSAMGPSELTPMRLTEEGRLPTTLAETRILFNGKPASLLYVSETQSSAIVPYVMAGISSVDVEVEYKGVRSSIVAAPVLPARSGIFTLNGSGRGQAAVLNENGSLNSAENPAVRGSVIVLFATGEGLTDPAGVDGQIIGGILPKPRLPVAVSMPYADCSDCDLAEVLYAAAVSQAVPGLLQVNVRVPEGAVVGSAVPLSLRIGDQWAQPQVTVAVR